MKIYGTTDAAAEIGCDSRSLRRFLRSAPAYRNAGNGGRYMFTEAELKSLSRDYHKAHKSATRREPVEESAALDLDPGVAVESLAMSKADRAKLRATRQQARAARQQRLVLRMHEVLPVRADDEVEVD